MDRITALVDGRSDEVLSALRNRLQSLSTDGRFDQAAVARDRLSALAAAIAGQVTFVDGTNAVAGTWAKLFAAEPAVVMAGLIALAPDARRAGFAALIETDSDWWTALEAVELALGRMQLEERYALAVEGDPPE